MYKLSSSSRSVISIVRYSSYNRNAISSHNGIVQAQSFPRSIVKPLVYAATRGMVGRYIDKMECPILADGRAISGLCSLTTVLCSTSSSLFFFGRPGLGPSRTCTSRITGLFKSRPRSIARSMMLWTVLGWIPVSRWISWFDTPSSLRVRA